MILYRMIPPEQNRCRGQTVTGKALEGIEDVAMKWALLAVLICYTLGGDIISAPRTGKDGTQEIPGDELPYHQHGVS